jgi:predicted DNA-binding antitoxin AbrB/MazE fold protein
MAPQTLSRRKNRLPTPFRWKFDDAMELTIAATYENGVLRPEEPLPLAEHEKVQVTVHAERSPLLEAYGMLRWTGDLETLEYLATDPEFDPQEG